MCENLINKGFEVVKILIQVYICNKAKVEITCTSHGTFAVCICSFLDCCNFLIYYPILMGFAVDCMVY